MANYTYDNYGNAETISHNGTEVAKNYADTSGNVIRSTDYINNLEYRAGFDSLGRLASKDVFDLTATGRNDKWSRSVEYQYDKLNNISKLSLAYSNGTNNTVHYMYNTAKLPSTVILPSNKNFNYHYDVLNRPTSTSINTTTPITAQYTYTGTARGASQYTSNLISTEVTNAFAYSYTYDRNGNITSIQNGTKQSDGSYTYSSLSGNEYIYDRYNQLKRDVDYDNATATYYSHDSNGNIAEKTVRGWDLQNDCPTTVIESNTYTYADNKGWGDLLTAYNGQTITYDGIGNPLNYRDGITMTWQNGRELATFKKGTVDVSYTYDTGGLRTSKSVVEDFVSTEYDYVYENGLLRQMTYGNHVYNISYDAYGTPVLLNHIIPTSGLNEYYYYGTNSRGDVEALYYSDGSLYATYDYDAYGKLLAITSFSGSDLTGTDTVATKNPLRYRGYVYDTETGLYYLQSRYYDPTTCRFVNADGYVSTGQDINGYNMFAYCNNNPVNYIDPTGMSSSALTWWSSLMWWLCAVDAALPIGDIAYVGGIIVTVGITIISEIKSPSQSVTISKDTIKENISTATLPPKKESSDTIIYRYYASSEDNLSPRPGKDYDGLSFSTTPHYNPTVPMVMTTIEQVNATGILKAEKTGPNHVTITPVNASVADWMQQGQDSIWYQTLSSIVIEWDTGD